MIRSFAVLLPLLVLSACANLPNVSQSCPAGSTASATLQAESDARSTRCGLLIAESRLSAVGAVQQTGGQTRTVGVPRGFLVAMIVLIVLVSLA